jgi:chromosome segregation ATPase
MMSVLETHVKRIQEKLQQLLKNYKLLQKENQRLKSDLENLQQQLPVQKETINKLQEQIEILKISAGNWNEDDKKNFEKRISGYLKEIDKCIAMLSK